MRKVTLSDHTLSDATACALFYERQEQGADDYFATHLEAALDSLALIHGIHPRKGKLFWMLLPKFPHAIFYREYPDTTEVVAIIDQRRDPRWIRRQLRTR